MKLYEFKPLKPPKNFHHKSSNIKNIHPNHQSNSLSFIGIKFQNLQKLQELKSIEVSLDSRSKLEELPLQILEDKEYLKNKEFLTSAKLEIHCTSVARISNPSSNAIVEDILFSSQEYINTILELNIFPRRSN